MLATHSYFFFNYFIFLSSLLFSYAIFKVLLLIKISDEILRLRSE